MRDGPKTPPINDVPTDRPPLAPDEASAVLKKNLDRSDQIRRDADERTNRLRGALKGPAKRFGP